jgi:hypothetical protein
MHGRDPPVEMGADDPTSLARFTRGSRRLNVVELVSTVVTSVTLSTVPRSGWIRTRGLTVPTSRRWPGTIGAVPVLTGREFGACSFVSGLYGAVVYVSRVSVSIL